MSISDRLRTETRDLHDAAENHPFQRLLFKGQLPVELYVANLSQLYLVHDALESSIREHLSATPALAGVVREYQFQVPYLAEDLRHFGIDPGAIEAGGAVRSLIERIRRTASESPVSLLGYHYVLEGSNNGSKYIARNVSRAYGLTMGGPGLRYLDPYGDEQSARWMEFKTDLLAVSLTESEQDAVVGAAREMFAGIAAIGGELMEAQPA